MVPAAQRQYTHSSNSLCGITQLGSFLTELINYDKQGALKIIFLDGKKNINKKPIILGYENIFFLLHFTFCTEFLCSQVSCFKYLGYFATLSTRGDIMSTGRA